MTAPALPPLTAEERTRNAAQVAYLARRLRPRGSWMVVPAPIALRRTLAALPITLRKLASLAGVDSSLVVRAAAGDRTLTAPVALQLAEALERTAKVCTAAAAQLRAHAASNE